MVRRRAVGLAAFGAAVVAGAAVGWAAERRAVAPLRLAEDPEWAELRRPVHGSPRTVVARDGTRLHAEVLGPDASPTVILLHGYALSQHVWHYQRRDLPPELRVVAYDLRGHGRSEAATDGDYSLHALADDLAAVIDAVVPTARSVVLVGHSLGGMTVMALADRYPELVAERVAGAVLLSTGASKLVRSSAFSVGVTALDAIERLVAVRTMRGPKRYRLSDLSFLGTREIALNHDASPAHVAFVEQLYVDVPQPVKGALAQTLVNIDVREALRVLDCPVLVLVGTQDRLTPPSQARAIADALRDATVVELQDIGHHAMLEAHDDVTGHLRRFTLAHLAGVA